MSLFPRGTFFHCRKIWVIDHRPFTGYDGRQCPPVACHRNSVSNSFKNRSDTWTPHTVACPRMFSELQFYCKRLEPLEALWGSHFDLEMTSSDLHVWSFCVKPDRIWNRQRSIICIRRSIPVPTAMIEAQLELLHSHRNRLPCCGMKIADGATYSTFDLFPSLLSRSFLKFEIMHTIRAQRDGDNHKKKLA